MVNVAMLSDALYFIILLCVMTDNCTYASRKSADACRLNGETFMSLLFNQLIKQIAKKSTSIK